MARFLEIKTKENAFTLIELLIVMAVFAMLISLGLSGFSSLKKVQQLEQAGQNMYAVLRDQQRQAMLFERQLDENWIWGTVVSFEELRTGGSKILLYKYCAPSSTVEFNSYPKESDNLPTSAKDSNRKCTRTTAGLTRMSSQDLFIDLPEFTAKLVGGSDVTYIVFETVSGKIHYYSSNGSALSLTSDVEVLLGANLPAKRLITFKSSTGRIELEKVDSTYQIK